jgi:hypothetical protein
LRHITLGFLDLAKREGILRMHLSAQQLDRAVGSVTIDVESVSRTGWGRNVRS